MKHYSILQNTLIILFGLVFAGCNNNDQLGPQTSVRISPTEQVWIVTDLLDANGNCVVSQDFYQDNVFVITVADSNGAPIGEAELSIYLSPSNSTSPPQYNNEYIFYLYDDLNNNGVVDHPQELVSGTGQPILYVTETERYHGTKSVIVRTNTSCSGYLASLEAFAGDGHASVSISTESPDDSSDDTSDTNDGSNTE
ncbi:MAG: hypothetical protein ABW092_10020 [Candidatus Thiodiazotropha sp.]